MERIESLRSRVESWIRDQAARVTAPPWMLTQPTPPWWRWPPWEGKDPGRRERERRLQKEYERQKQQLRDLCQAVKADTVADLQEVLCSMVLSECVYKRPETEMIHFINKFKTDFGGKLVSLERVQPSLDHVSHSYLLAEAGDTLFASFIGTKKYKDIIADLNIFQGEVFGEDAVEDFYFNGDNESQLNKMDNKNNVENVLKKVQHGKLNSSNSRLKPAAHRGFLARAKGIPALELYKLAKKKNRKLVLCGHSLGGAVAALSTLAILRILLSSSLSKDTEKLQIRCITFSQPPVGNAALRDYVHEKGWQQYFQTFCIPEDLVPRILSPAYFHHYNSRTSEISQDADGASSKDLEAISKKFGLTKKKDGAAEERLVLGLGPVQTSFWRLLKLVPLDSVRKHLDLFKRTGNKSVETPLTYYSPLSALADAKAEPQSLQIQENSEGISLTPIVDRDGGPGGTNGGSVEEKNSQKVDEKRIWGRVPDIPSYVPFGQLYLLGNSSVELLSDAEYSKLTSVSSVIAELRERFRSHSMRSYRSRFQKIYELCMCVSSSSSTLLGMDQVSQFPSLQQWLGLTAAGAVKLGHIAEPPVILTATSVVPLGWSGVPGDKSSELLKVDIFGIGLHLCTLVHARVNGKWCSTAVELLPPLPPSSSVQQGLQKMRLLIGSPLRGPLKHPVVEDSLLPLACVDVEEKSVSSCEEKMPCCGGLNDFVVYCTSDFTTASKDVHVRTRRVRLLGFEGAGKTSLLHAIIGDGGRRNNSNILGVLPDLDVREAVVGGVCYLDSPGINLQELQSEASRFRNELSMDTRGKKTDLIALVHNLSQVIPWDHCSDRPQPALSLFLNDAVGLGIPWVLAVTNKFSVRDSRQRKMLVSSVVEAYQASASVTEVLNSSAFLTETNAVPVNSAGDDPAHKAVAAATSKLMFSPSVFSQIPFHKKAAVVPVEGVGAFRQLVHRVLRDREEIAFQELADERLALELARKQESCANRREGFSVAKGGGGGATAAAMVGASLGAGLGLVMAIVMGAVSALRKP